MHYRVIRDEQEYGPYTVEEITQYVNEGSILPNDYVHNGMEWLPVSQFLQNPHKAEASMHSISSVAKAQPEIKYTKSKYDPGNSGGELKNSFKSIGGAIIIIVLLVYYFFEDRNAKKAEKFNNELVLVFESYEEKGIALVGSGEVSGEEIFKQMISLNQETLQQIEDVPFYEGKKGVGYQLKENAIELINRVIKFAKDNIDLLAEVKKKSKKLFGEDSDAITKLLGSNPDTVSKMVTEGGSLESLLNTEEGKKLMTYILMSVSTLEKDFEKDRVKLDNQFEDLQKQYANNNGLEFEKN